MSKCDLCYYGRHGLPIILHGYYASVETLLLATSVCLKQSNEKWMQIFEDNSIFNDVGIFILMTIMSM